MKLLLLIALFFLQFIFCLIILYLHHWIVFKTFLGNRTNAALQSTTY